MILILMVNDQNGRLPLASEATLHGANRPGENYEQYELRMYYHEGVIKPRYPVPAIYREG